MRKVNVMSDPERTTRSRNLSELLELDEEGNSIDSGGAESIFPTYSNIPDPIERAEAYEQLAKTYFDSLKSERKTHLKDSKENTKLIKIQEKDIVELQRKNESLAKQLGESKERIEQSDKNLDIDDKNKHIIELEKEIQIISEQLKNTKAVLEQHNQGEEHVREMNLEVKDVIAGIPVFSGDPKKLEGFTNSCDIYYNLATDQQKAGVLQIIKAKITGEGLAKAGPFGDDLNTWALLKTRLKARIKQPISFEYAQQDLSNVFQKSNENIEDYGARVKTKLRNLNEASKKMATTTAEKTILCKANEKYAISKFQQNIRNQTIKVLVSASTNENLDECIAFAMQKELIEKGTNIKSCNFCGLQNHDESSCRKKRNQGNEHQKKNNTKFDKKYNNDSSKKWRDRPNNGPQTNYQSGSHNNYSTEKSNQDRSDKQEKQSQPGTSQNWRYKNNNSNNHNQRSVKIIDELQEETISVEDAIRLAENSKN